MAPQSPGAIIAQQILQMQGQETIRSPPKH
jgi:hypothetical protein